MSEWKGGNPKPPKREKKPKKPLKRSYIRYKRPPQEKIDKEKAELTEMRLFFLEIWNERPHKSEVSGLPLYEPLDLFFDHLLPKKKWPQYKLCRWNIALVTWEEHTNKGNGFPHPKHQELIDAAWQKHLEITNGHSHS